MDSFWQDKTVLVTGHTGFKGSWLSLWLQLAGAKVVGYSLEDPPTKPSLFDVVRVGQGMNSLAGDVRSLDDLTSAVERYRPDVVFHMAAQAIVRMGVEDPVGTYSTNVIGTLNLLEAIRQFECARAVVVVTSDKCYENREKPDYAYREGNSYKDGDLLGGRDPYSDSKACAELITRTYRHSFFASADHKVAVATARSGNVVGGGDWAPHRLVPDIMKWFLNRRVLTVRYPDATRPWQYVLDPLAGYLTLAERLYSNRGAEFSEAWNFGPSDQDQLTVGEIVQEVEHQWGELVEKNIQPDEKPREAGLLHLDASKARECLAWTARLSIQETLAWTTEWYRAYSQRKDMRRFTEDQIKRYQEL